MAAEKRLIDANALLEAGNETKMPDVFPDWLNMTIAEQAAACKHGRFLKNLIQKLPTVDAVEVVHGRWLPMYQVDWIYGKEWLTDYICTECGQLHKKKSNYCPNCGAKMDGDGNGK